jgi:hypothetical protein
MKTSFEGGISLGDVAAIATLVPGRRELSVGTDGIMSWIPTSTSWGSPYSKWTADDNKPEGTVQTHGSTH